MKRVLLSCLALCIVVALNAQERSSIPKEFANISVQAVHGPELDGTTIVENSVNPYVKSFRLPPEEDEIGETQMDLQTNRSVQSRLTVYGDGTMGAVWMMGIQQAPNFPDRGTGYNFFNGSSWGPTPTNRVETVRTGWPSYAPLGANGEIVVSHISGTAGLVFNKRDTKGIGAWEEFNYAFPAGASGYLWPRMITGGADHNTIHLLGLTTPSGNGGVVYQGQDGALLYSRSTDGGMTWDIQHQLLPEMGAAFYRSFTADSYGWADPVGNTIAFVVANPWHDTFVMKSEDNGTTWTKLMIHEHMFPLFDWDLTITTDTLWACDGSSNVAICPNGMVHVVFALSRVAHTEAGTSYSYWPYTDGIVYWNESMGALPAHPTNPYRTLHADYLYDNGYLIGWTQDVDGDGEVSIFEMELQVYRTLGLSTMPTIHVDAMGKIFVIFSSITEGFDDGTHYYKKLWARTSPDSGTTWGDFYHVTDDIMHMFDECIFPVLAHHSDEYIYYMYMADETPGLALDDDHPYQTNRIIFAKLLKEDVVGIGKNVQPQLFVVSQNFPNPVKGSTTFSLELDTRTSVSVEVYNLMGQKVMNMDKGMMAAGANQIQLNMADFAPGLYFYTVKAGNQIVTRKMIVE
jgi:hypothetical protein